MLARHVDNVAVELNQVMDSMPACLSNSLERTAVTAADDQGVAWIGVRRGGRCTIAS